ncbi:uncharacterized protein EI90DRAFT_3019367 [Cantharellus anzutake]|uniref:uncharacterized protein n=1 Tax=Cantharellus anzutake TaxID=1750568 RepID=UPI001908D983|nr:uncharacterized protein EI90DRAFT_3019367 [Cantharellus anzutake]KAF8324908.1 hypothetical protein EI90DRAFT_3019367 [Cantharellus anzutake]
MPWKGIVVSRTFDAFLNSGYTKSCGTEPVGRGGNSAQTNSRILAKRVVQSKCGNEANIIVRANNGGLELTNRLLRYCGLRDLFVQKKVGEKVSMSRRKAANGTSKKSNGTSHEVVTLHHRSALSEEFQQENCHAHRLNAENKYSRKCPEQTLLLQNWVVLESEAAEKPWVNPVRQRDEFQGGIIRMMRDFDARSAQNIGSFRRHLRPTRSLSVTDWDVGEAAAKTIVRETET